MRWRMCDKCNVKLIIEDDNSDVILENCPVCKGHYLTIKDGSKLLSELYRIGKIRNMSVKELLLESLDNLKKFKEDKINEN